MSEKPITIAGAGVSGLTAAINLARSGRSVIVYDKRKTSYAPFFTILSHGDPRAKIGGIYRFSLKHKRVFPFARWYLRSKYKGFF